MGRRRNWKNWNKWHTRLLILLLAWVFLQGRFYLPKWVRPAREVPPIEVEMKITAYCHCGKCCSYNWFLFLPYQKTGRFSFRLKHVGKTASGTMAHPGTIAADTSIYPYGTVMFIPGYGYGRVEDIGGAIKGKHIDLYFPNHWLALNWGEQTKKVKVWFPTAEDEK